MIDGNLYEFLANGTLNALGAVGNNGLPVSMTASPQQLLVASNGNLFVYFLQTQTINSVVIVAGTFQAVPGPPFPGYVDQVGYCDGFFIALVASTEQYFVSNSLDATTWQGIQSKIISVFPDNVISMVVDHREIWLLGSKSTDVEYDSGNLFPFDTCRAADMETGCGATFGTVQMDNSIFWIGQRNDRGGRRAWRANGYTPQRVSNFAVETAWATYQTVSDAVAFSYEDQGHEFWVINFPSAEATWVYDAATQLWHERASWNKALGAYQAALPQCHTYNFGKHLVGDRTSGTIYEMAIPQAAVGGGWNFVTDADTLIHRMRRAPHVSTEQEWLRYSSLQVDFETGLGTFDDGAGNLRGAVATLRYSKDGGHTWSNGRDVDCGQIGNYRTRAMWRRLGRARDMVFEVTVSDPIPWRIVNAYLKATPGFAPQERLVKQFGKVA